MNAPPAARSLRGGRRVSKKKESLERPFPAGRALLFGDDLEHLFVAFLRHGNGVCKQLFALFAALIARSRLVLHDGSTACGAQFEETALPPLKRALYRVLSVALRPVRHLL